MIEKPMKSLAVGEVKYIITDAEAREDIETLQTNVTNINADVTEINGEVTDLKSAVGYDPIVFAEIEQYSINPSTGKDTTSSYTKYYRTGGFYQPKHIKATSTRGTLKTVVYYYGSADVNTFISADSDVDNMDTDITYPTGANYVRVAGYVVGNPDDPLDLSAVTVEMTLPASKANSRVKELEQETSAIQEYVYKTDGRITQPSANLVDADFLLGFGGWAKSGEGENAVYSGLSTNISAIAILSDIFDENTVYTASFEAYTDQESVTSGNGFRIYYDYADGTTLSKYVQNTATSWTLISLTSSFTKTISAFRIALASGAKGNTWHVRKFQLTKGNRVNAYVPSISACDTVTADAVKAATADMFRANWWNNGRIRMAMHQGMRSESQPVGNCELSFRTAGINKAWAIETDLRKTSDGKWVCFHDQSVDNLTDGTGNVSSLTYDQIRALHYVSQTTGETTDQIIPSLEEYMQICKTYNCVPLMEFKIRPTIEDCEDVIELLTSYGIFGYMFIADIVATSATIRAVTDAPLFQIADSIDTYNTVSAYIKASSLRNCGIDFDYNLGNSITAEMISDMHQNRMFCGVYSLNNIDSIKNWFSLGMDIVTSDRIADLTT